MIHALVELPDVKLVAVARPLGVIPHVTAYVLHEVVHTALLDAGRGGTDEAATDVAIDYGHDSVHPNAVVHREHLDLAQLAALADLPFTVAADGKRSVGNPGGQLCNDLFPMRKQPAALAAFLPLCAAQHLVEGVRHIAVLHDLFDDMPFSAHSCFWFVKCGLAAFNPWA